MRIVVGITGASGAVYGYRLLEVLQVTGCEVHAVVSKHGWEVLEYECGVGAQMVSSLVHQLYHVDDITAPIASGSFRTDAMIIAPCSMHTLGLIAGGIAGNLLTRAADVTIKENRPLILVPRETPVHAIHLENMLRLARIGVRILPACPGFYHRPRNLQALIDMMVGKICDQLNIQHQLYERWQGQQR
ncbi:3-octaprenyl-4-hydroxybenzoate carboxy-lyase [Thermosinus carboxydivorans Nor1]|uniref:Flavin prenyltransferase UbiX n=1 Tax=Thermosinus carboxydivorans Nor1 TaxID=401526 RepID=A1HN63_9FIRM|nr:UbiX family flavin prenyltransferase [Thermosinus carboxydivorans]EAX48689.1 3-octaprenyl-4-hydroxybenzoate carboxy-lyase [Thermosinus carboxydivorans Nor1]